MAKADLSERLPSIRARIERAKQDYDSNDGNLCAVDLFQVLLDAEWLLSALAEREALATDNVLSSPQAAGLLLQLKEECEAQHARAEQAEARVSALQLENEKLRDWKWSALQSLGRWHALGDVLWTIAPGTLGVDIPTYLATAIPERVSALQRELEEARAEIVHLKDTRANAPSSDYLMACLVAERDTLKAKSARLQEQLAAVPVERPCGDCSWTLIVPCERHRESLSAPSSATDPMRTADPTRETLRHLIRQAYLEGLARQRQGLQAPEQHAEAYAEWAVRMLASEALSALPGGQVDG